jgi:Tfp pilus assembly protein PilZ
VRENRKQARTRLLKLIRVKSNDTQRLFGHVVDISVGGMMVQTHQQVSTGDYLNLAIEIPTDIHPKPLDIHAEVTWVSEKNKHNTYSMGCRFVAIEKTERDALLELARKYPMGEEEL